MRWEALLQSVAASVCQKFQGLTSASSHCGCRFQGMSRANAAKFKALERISEGKDARSSLQLLGMVAFGGSGGYLGVFVGVLGMW